MTLRTLLVKLGFKGDIAKLTDFDKRITGLKSNVLGLGVIFASVTASLGYFLNEAAKLEQTRIAFQVMTNSVQYGQKLIKDLFRFARTTPFQIPGVLQASKILLAMGITAENQMDTLEKIGHVAAGIGKPLDQLASIFGRVKAAGYLTGYEMERLRRAGVPLGAYLSELLKKPEKAILQMIRRKEISFEKFSEGWELMVEERFPKLMDKLLLTFKGMMSNIKDFIYEIVAFSGEELLPVFKKMASQLLYLLDTSREFVDLRFRLFFRQVSNGLELVNKGFIKLYFRTRETAQQFGGFSRIFKVFAILFGGFVGMKSLALLGRIGKMTFTLLSFASLKLALIGASMLLIFGVVEDFFGYIIGKESFIERFLSMLEKKAPGIHGPLLKGLRILKKEIEGLTLMLYGILTLNKDAMKAGAEQVSEAWKMIFEKGKKQKVGIKGIFKPQYDIDTEGMNFLEKQIAVNPMLRWMAEKTEKMKDFVDYAFVEGKYAPSISNKGKEERKPLFKMLNKESKLDPNFYRDTDEVLQMLNPIIWLHKLTSMSQGKDYELLKFARDQQSTFNKEIERANRERNMLKGSKALRGNLNVNIPLTMHFEKLGGEADEEKIAQKIQDKVRPIVGQELDNILKTQQSAIEPDLL